ncbi:MAG: ABC transporter ATP-binding protein [Actinobacteria bacterium]|nr:ABC transporter ATP-binding protein [Actinomycetota bacterium]
MILATELVKHYRVGDHIVEALRGVTLTVPKNEFLAIMGPSGSGKSTLMHILGCLDHPTSGTLHIDEEEINITNQNRLAELRNKKIGFVFQQFNLLSRTSAINNVELPLLYAGASASERHKRAQKALEMVGLGHRTGHFPNQLSGGEQQRVAIARALITDPPVILADEPTGNLDTKSGNEVLAILQSLHKRGITLIMVTHERDVGEHADRIVHMLDGRITGDEMVEDKKLATSTFDRSLEPEDNDKKLEATVEDI